MQKAFLLAGQKNWAHHFYTKDQKRALVSQTMLESLL